MAYVTKANFSNIRDILFYCKKENIELILLALDYSKAFDSVDFEFIHKTFELLIWGKTLDNGLKLFKLGTKVALQTMDLFQNVLKSTGQQDKEIRFRLLCLFCV